MITALRIENFKAFKQADLTFANLTLLTGLNGMGKTTVIQSLLLLRQSYEKKTLPDRGLFLNGDYITIGVGKDAYCYDGAGDHITFHLEWDTQHDVRFEFSYSPESNLQPLTALSGVEGFDPFGTALFNNNFQYLNAERLSPRLAFPTSAYHVEQLGSLGAKGEYTAHFIALNQRESVPIKNICLPGSKSRTLLSQLDAWMGLIVPGVRLSATILTDVESVKLGYKFETSRGVSDEFKPINVGFGLTYVLPVVTAILSAKPGDLLIIENPESHLHPAGQAVVGRLCALAAQNGVQMIIESHSDHILNGIRVAVKQKMLAPENAAFYFFQRDVNQPEHSVDIIEPFIDQHGRLDKKPNGFFDEWGKQLDQLIK